MKRAYGRFGKWAPVLLLAAAAAVAGHVATATATAADGGAAAEADRIRAATGVTGGLIVHVGCDDGKLTAALGAGEGLLVQGLDTDADAVARARAHIRSLGACGKVSVDLFDGSRLPYVDGLVNLVVSADPGNVPMKEVLRVLRPGGVAYVKTGGTWRKTLKPRAAALDDWTHTLHDASNNAVGHDTAVGPPQHMRWVSGPRNARHHERLASVSAAVSAGGRLFYIIDEAPTASILLEPRWALLARDAFNGVELWRRPINEWEAYLRPFRNGPPQLSRRLVATDRELYVTLGYGKPLTALDTATGKTVRTYEGTEGAEEIRYSGSVLYLVVADAPAADGPAGAADAADAAAKSIVALEAATGRQLWRRRDAAPLPTTLAIAGGRVFYQDAVAVYCLDAKTGRQLWRTPRPAAAQRPGWSAPTLVAAGDVVLSADRLAKPSPAVTAKARKQWAAWLVSGGPPGELVAFDAKTGDELWRCECAEVYHAPVDVFVIDGLVWVGSSAAGTGPDFAEGRDLRTGKVVRRIDASKAFQTTMPHHRCHRDRATGHWLVTGRTGVEFIDVRTGAAFRHHWVRGVCQYGVLPCNGLLYAPPHSCACFIEAKLTGFLALAPASAEPADGSRVPPGLRRGPAFDAMLTKPKKGPAAKNPQSATCLPAGRSTIRNLPAGRQVRNREDWPTYRHDAARSGVAGTAIDPNLTCLWQADLGGAVSSPVVANGRAFVAAVDAHTVHALDAATGKPLWQFVAGGRVDSPPTVYAGRVVFGSRDGYVRCLRASDGQLAWCFRAAPRDRRIVAFGQVESAWPVHGSVLVDDGGVRFVAGRSSYLDGGLAIWRLDLATGKVLAHERLYSRDPNTGEQPDEPEPFHMTGALPDVLSSDGESVYMRRMTLDPAGLKPREVRPHLYSPAGFLNGDWWHRTYWIYGTHFYSGYIGWYFAGRETPAGRLLVLDDASIYGFGYTPEYYRGATGRQYHLFAIDRSAQQEQPSPDYKRAQRDYPARGQRKFGVKFRWTKHTRLLARAMVLAGDKLLLAGPPDAAIESTAVLEGERGGRLSVVSAADGEAIANYKLDVLPVFDGMAAANGRVYLSTTNGRLLCLGAGKPAKDARSPIRPLTESTHRPPAAPEPGLVGYWKLDEGDGTTAYDSSGGAHDGEVRGRWAKGPFGTALRTAGKAGALTIRDGEHLHFGTGDFSVAFRVSVEAFDRRLMGKENFPQRWWVINLLKDGRLEMVIGQGQGAALSVRAPSRTALAAQAWTHVAYVVDRKAGQVRCYLNGALDSTTAIPAGLTAEVNVAGTDLRVPSAHKPFAGLFGDLRIYSRALTDEQVKAIAAPPGGDDKANTKPTR